MGYQHLIRSIFLQLAMVVSMMLLGFSVKPALALTEVPRYGVYELQFTAGLEVERPFDDYLLKLEVTDPEGNTFFVDGFFDGNNVGGQRGRTWKARLCPYAAGHWQWKTVPGDLPDPALQGLSGSFRCVAGAERGGLVREGRHFRLQNGDFIYLQGNFLDFVDDLPSTHVYMSHVVSDAQRAAVLARQRETHAANKINVYLANRGDYGGLAVSPWLEGDAGTMDLARWKDFDRYLLQFAEAGLFAELWFFADDSNFGSLSQADRNRLFRYAMARTSAFSHTLYVIALEWQEGWSKESVRSSGNFIQRHNPWKRLLSVHSLPAKAADSVRSYLSLLFKKFFRDLNYSQEPWADFIASQAGNDAMPGQVNSLALEMYASEPLPHLSEEFGILKRDRDQRLLRNAWANLCGGAAGGGTGDGLDSLMEFLSASHIPFQRMKPLNELVAESKEGVFCLAEPGHHFLVFSDGSPVTLLLSGTGLTGQWIDPRARKAQMGRRFKVAAGKQRFEPPFAGTDYVLWITDGTNLNSGRLYPDGSISVIKEVVSSPGDLHHD